ncbi:MAG: hypothetical protein K1X88_24315 [Nannocystaceae bacterium]|nr:hypothetical protein [Nannocystaceae bacterium]
MASLRRGTTCAVAPATLWLFGLSGCADPCLDDGLGQSACPTQDAGTDSAGSSGSSGSISASATDSESATMTAGSLSASGSGSESGTGASDTEASGSSSATADSSASASASSDGGSDGSSSGGGGTLWCPDTDMDGFGDADGCVNADDPPPGTVDNDDDCDDGDPTTFPGAAPLDDRDACMHDGDGDDWGDDAPGPGIDPGSDCDDDDAATFPGAAELDADPTACTRDGDGDGWGDANPGGTAVPGADCFDGNDALNPDTMALGVFVDDPSGDPVFASVDPTDAALTAVAPLDTPGAWNPVSATIDETGTIVVNNDAQNRLYRVDYLGVCGGDPEGETTPAQQAHGIDIFCGISFGQDGVLYGVQNATDELAVLDPLTGLVVSSMPLQQGGAPFDAASCGMTFDCHEQRLLYAHGPGGDIFSLDPATGALTLLADTDLVWSPTGLAYDPIDRVVWVAGDTVLHRIAIDGSNTVEVIGDFDFGPGGDVTVSNLEVLPICG